MSTAGSKLRGVSFRAIGWTVLAFTGQGFVDSRDGVEETDDEINAFSAGVRYLVLEKQNVWMGIDAARGPEDEFGYIQIGTPW